MWIRGKQRSFFSFDKADGLSAKLAEHVHSIMDAARRRTYISELNGALQNK